MKTIQELIKDFSYIEEWDDKYRYLIELGDTLPSLAENQKTKENKVPGCMSQVWVVSKKEEDGTYTFHATSDASIVQGLVAIIVAIFSGHTKDEILTIQVDKFFDELDIANHISPSRRNGLYSMVEIIKKSVQT